MFQIISTEYYQVFYFILINFCSFPISILFLSLFVPFLVLLCSLLDFSHFCYKLLCSFILHLFPHLKPHPRILSIVYFKGQYFCTIFVLKYTLLLYVIHCNTWAIRGVISYPPKLNFPLGSSSTDRDTSTIPNWSLLLTYTYIYCLDP